MSKDNKAPSPESLQTLLKNITADSNFVAIHPLEGDFSNSTHLVDCKAPDGTLFQVVKRRYAIFGDYDRGEKARREFKTLQLLKTHRLPVPEPLYLDDTGKILGSPGIVTRYVPGKLHMARLLAFGNSPPQYGRCSRPTAGSLNHPQKNALPTLWTRPFRKHEDDGEG
jgi:hypothetical protein